MADQFIKMHGLGNDFVIIDARRTPVTVTPAFAMAVADRREGIGCDQLIVLGPSDKADAAMHIFNADGSMAEACGNASRCVATLFPGPARIETAGGVLALTPGTDSAEVDMGEPLFDWELIPLAMPMDTAAMPVAWDGLESPMAVNVGNPHVVFFVPDSAAINLAEVGPTIETDPLFPRRVNVNIASLRGDGGIDLRVWERGAGLTRACGTGACAAAVAAIRQGLAQSPVTVHLPGGALTIDWVQGGSIRMAGPATRVFDGTTDWSRFA